MPELASPNGYKLPQIRYEPPRTPTFEPTQIVPDLRGAAALQGSAASLNLVAQTIAQLPELVTKSLASGRKEAQQKEVHSIKMDALAGNRTPAQTRALEGFSFGEDDSLSYKPTDPLLSKLKYEDAVADIARKKALTHRALLGPQKAPSLYERITGTAADGGALPEPGEEPDYSGVTPGSVLPPLPGDAAAPRGRAALSGEVRVPETEEELRAMQDIPNTPQAPLAGEPALGALAPVSSANRAVLAQLPAGPPTAPIPSPAEAPATAAELPADGIVKPTAPGGAVLLRRGGKTVAELRPGQNAWTTITEKPEGRTFANKEAAEEAGYDTAGAQVNADGSITVKKIPIAKDQQVPASLAKEARDLGLNAYGKDPKAVTEEIINFRRAATILNPEQVKNVNALQTKLSSDVAYKDIQNVKQAYTAMQGSQKQDSAIGDVALINSFQRIIDPGVSVREGDVTLIQNSAGILEQLKNLPDVWAGNARIPDKMRKQMIELGKDVYTSKVKNFYDSKGKAIVAQAQAYNIPEEHFDVLGLDFGIPLEGVKVPGSKPKADATPNGQPAVGNYIPGKRYRGQDGSIRTYLGGAIEDEANWGK